MTEIVVSISPENIEEVDLINLDSLEGANIIEWRADFLKNADEIFKLAPAIFEKFTGYNVLFTLRTIREGGYINLTDDEYIDILQNILSYDPAYIDIEYFSYKTAFEKLKDYKEKIVLSYHNFTEIPMDLHEKMKQMIDEETYLVKFAGMPKTERNVLELMYMTEELVDRFPNSKIATVAMGSLGKISRIAGHLTKSAWTFAPLTRENAPGQIPFVDMKKIFKLLDY